MTTRMRAFRLPLLVAVLLLSAAGCQRMWDSVSLLVSIGREFDARDLHISSKVTPSEAHLTVIFRHSPLADRPEAERRAHARRVAEYVRDHYPRYGELDDVSVAYFRGGYEPAGYLAPPGSYTFTRAELGPLVRLPRS